MTNRTIRTSSKEIYQKFNTLKFTNSIILDNVRGWDLTKLVKNINRNGHILSVEKIDTKHIIKRHKPIDFNIYMTGNCKH